MANDTSQARTGNVAAEIVEDKDRLRERKSSREHLSAGTGEEVTRSTSAASSSGAKHLYHGHRRNSFTTKDIDELTELRARQRTFEGAYLRTALGMAVYACIILKIFSSSFAKIGIIYVVISAMLIIISIVRRRESMHDFADKYQRSADYRPGGKRHWGRQFKTVGNLVIGLSCIIGGLELAIFIVLMRMG